MKKFILLTIMMVLGTLIYSFRVDDSSKTSTASYYHDKFHGRRTASGETYDKKAFTAANKTLPFGTRVKITNLKNNKSVVVRVNDRGPFTKNRAFDLSKAAFMEIASLKSGVIPISYEIIAD